MAQEKMLSGCAAAAQGAKYAEVEVICSFPIRPYTAIMMELARMVANGNWMRNSFTAKANTPRSR